MPIFLISILSVLTFGVNEDGSKIDAGSRAAMSLTLLLTSISYKFVGKNQLQVIIIIIT